MSVAAQTSTPPPPPPPPWYRRGASYTLKKTALFILRQWLLIGIGVVCVLAYYFPNVAKNGGIIRSEYSILYGAMALIFLISGLSVPREKLFRHLLNWRLHVLVQVSSFLFIPALMLALVHIILAGDPHQHIDRAVLAGYIFLACIPTTIASNVVMTRSAGGDDAAALVEVIIANFLGPFITAGWTITLLPADPAFDPWRAGDGNLGDMYRDVFKQLGLAVLLPLVVGQLVRWTWPDRTAWVLQTCKLAKLSTACLLLLLWSTFSSCFATNALQTMSTQNIIFVVLFNIALYVFLTGACFLISRPPTCLSRIEIPIPIPVSAPLAAWLSRKTTIQQPHPKETPRSNLVTFKMVRVTPFRPLPPKEAIAVCFCGPAKSTALGIPLLYAMWGSLELYLKAKTSVPVLLFTTEQICVAQLFVHLLGWWRRRVEREEDCEGGGIGNGSGSRGGDVGGDCDCGCGSSAAEAVDVVVGEEGGGVVEASKHA
ncbi:uncharacterized protein BP01DRAFT_382642 [Aspergillus saccharolyticus JOP 1030-1]|uniref:Sodium bile acid transporter family protein n=1 Tax=Aspergillus saccharolyticus JOP 1030-1 TaxID=1450539 RepID=A0A318ZNY4_9EURO|nr:hypothetical protein BP01DRAFT_382642 [Aspergillus saccharolyticus JOP 1030-1]PYH45620.1 hypothetical protein BP01DRAFT_382642 [Aspergillus saccharolyticus JOP 1030-1]